MKESTICNQTEAAIKCNLSLFKFRELVDKGFFKTATVTLGGSGKRYFIKDKLEECLSKAIKPYNHKENK